MGGHLLTHSPSTVAAVGSSNGDTGRLVLAALAAQGKGERTRRRISAAAVESVGEKVRNYLITPKLVRLWLKHGRTGCWVGIQLTDNLIVVMSNELG